MTEHVEQAKTGKFSAFFSVVSPLLSPKQRSHDFTSQALGIDYAFESFNQGKQGYLTGQNVSVNQGDSIVLIVNDAAQEYEVKEIDYYTEPDSMWIARVVRINRL
jgi:hypothetical protein